VELLLAIVAWIVSRQGVRTGWLNALALVTALLFTAYLGNMIITARSVPAIHDVATNLDDLPQFSRLTVRADNLENIPDEGKAELAALPPEERWKALHRQAYGDLRRCACRAAGRGAAAGRAAGPRARLGRRRGRPRAGTLEATATTLFFRYERMDDRHHRRLGPLRDRRAGGGAVDRVETPWGAPSDQLLTGRIGRSSSSSCPATAAATASRRATSTPAPTSMR
jgi:hypothetical protein